MNATIRRSFLNAADRAMPQRDFTFAPAKPPELKPVDSTLAISHSGMFGDMIWACAAIKEIVRLRGDHQPADLYLYPKWPFFPVNEKTLAMIEPLLVQQPYIRSVQLSTEPVGMDINVFWPAVDIVPGWNIVDHYAHALKLRHTIQNDAWLTATSAWPSRIVVHRCVEADATEKRHNPLMPWRQIVDRFGDRAVFVGTPKEHAAFSAEFGSVQHWPTADFFEVATIIQAAKFVFTDQGAVHTIAEAMKKPLMQETSPTVPSVIFHRPGTWYTDSPTVDFEAIAAAVPA